MKTLVIIPAYNERENILKTIDDIKKFSADVDYIVVNDCSTDGTNDLLTQKGEPFLDLPINLGIGGAVQAGYRYAKEHGYDIAVQFDGDGQHSAQYIKSIIAPIEHGDADFVIGSRFIEKKGFQSSAMRRAGILFLSGLLHVLCKVRIKDVTSGMRAVNRAMICEFAQDYAQDYPEPEAILSAGLKGARIVEVPVEMRERQGGTSSIDLLKSVYYMVKVSLALVISRICYKRKVTT